MRSIHRILSSSITNSYIFGPFLEAEIDLITFDNKIDRREGDGRPRARAGLEKVYIPENDGAAVVTP